jgi:hypothetical protein
VVAVAIILLVVQAVVVKVAAQVVQVIQDL